MKPQRVASAVWRHYGFAVVVTLLMTAIRFGLQPILGIGVVPYASYLVATMVAAWYGGFGPALLVTVLGGVLGLYFFVPPAFSLAIPNSAQLFSFIFYLTVGLTIAIFSEVLHRARRLADKRAWELHESQERLSTILTSIGDGVITTDTQGLVTFMNPAAQAMTGWQQAEAVGRLLQEVFTIINETTRESVEAPVARVLKEGRVVGLANGTLLIARDGRELPIEDSGAPIQDATGTLWGVVLVFHDVSERKRTAQELAASENRYRSLWENANDIFYTLDLDGHLTSLNRAGELIMGYAREELLHKPIAPIVSRSDLPTMQEMMARKIDGGQQETTYELEIVRKDGRRVTLEVSSRLIDQQGQPVGIQGVARDVTERKRAEEERTQLLLREQAARHDAEEALRFRDEFLAVAAHELKTPLTTIKGYISVLQRRAERTGESDPRDARVLQVISEQALRLQKLIELLLDLSRIQSGQLQIERAPVDLGEFVRRWIESAEPLVEAHTINFIASSEPLLVLADELRLEQVFQNLFQNALKYSPEGGTVTVRVEREGEYACLSVADQGIGIPSAELPNLFTRFHRARNFSSLQISGLGLGLFVVKEIVTLHDGTISVESTEGQGSTFTVSLPIL